MGPETLRDWAKRLRTDSSEAGARHANAARRLAEDALTARERVSLEAVAKVFDCQMRRNRIWADLLESAASEVEET